MEYLIDKIENLPDDPGVYLFKDEKGTILYVGKAGNVRHRVSSYFQKEDGKDVKTLALLEKVADIDTIVTDTEKEAFILENNLIKEHRPRYNVKLRDDKTYPLLKLSVKEEFPTLCIVRRAQKDGSLYFGPYPSATSLRQTLRLIRKLFPIRTCIDTKFTHRLRPCLNYEMGRCAGPCSGKIEPSQYREIVQQVKLFLAGKDKDLVERLRERMQEESEALHFETAARIRDQIRHIEHVIEKQKIVSSDFVDQDVIGLHRQNHTVILYLLFVRAGKLLGGKGFTLSLPELPDEEIVSSFIRQYYSREGRFIPKKILVPKAPADWSLVEQWLRELKGETTEVILPERGDKKYLVNMACENAEKYLLADSDGEKDRERFLRSLKEILHLRKVPRRIEGFDISNIRGTNAVGSMVVFEDGKAARDRYRHFKIRTIEGADDYGMMYEVLLRRYQKAIEQKDLPDLVLLDGGRGQLNVGQEVFKELGIQDVDLISLAKEKVTGGLLGRFRKTEEKVFHPQFKDPMNLGKHSALLHLLDRIRDEAHRFAITYHKKLRGRETVKSQLGQIPGIGEGRERELLKFFGSTERIRVAPVDQLFNVPKMNRRSAQAVYHFFHPENNPS